MKNNQNLKKEIWKVRKSFDISADVTARDCAIASEKALAKCWLSAEDEEAFKDL